MDSVTKRLIIRDMGRKYAFRAITIGWETIEEQVAYINAQREQMARLGLDPDEAKFYI